MNLEFVPNEFAQAETQPHWMVVDDNRDLLQVTAAMLAWITNVPVKCFPSPTEALAAFQAAPRKYALVITDFEMPGLTGAELCRLLQGISPGLKVLLATGSGGIASHSAATAMGFCGLLRKPFMIGDVKTALTNAGVIGDRAGDLLTKETSGLMLA